MAELVAAARFSLSEARSLVMWLTSSLDPPVGSMGRLRRFTYHLANKKSMVNVDK